MATQPERIASLETHRYWYWVALTVLASWLAYISILALAIKGDMQAIKQKIRDGGLGDIVAELQAPKSPEQLQASLATVTAQIKTARANGTRPDHKKVQALSGALSRVVQNAPQMPEAWQAAAEVISYRSQGNVPDVQSLLQANLPLCHGLNDILVRDKNWKPIDPKTLPIKYMVQSECRVHIDGMSIKNWGCNLCVIEYSGGPVEMANVRFINCVFIFDLPLGATPSSGGKHFGETLLEASDLEKVEIPTLGE